MIDLFKGSFVSDLFESVSSVIFWLDSVEFICCRILLYELLLDVLYDRGFETKLLLVALSADRLNSKAGKCTEFEDDDVTTNDSP